MPDKNYFPTKNLAVDPEFLKRVTTAQSGVGSFNYRECSNFCWFRDFSTYLLLDEHLKAGQDAVVGLIKKLNIPIN